MQQSWHFKDIIVQIKLFLMKKKARSANKIDPTELKRRFLRYLMKQLLAATVHFKDLYSVFQIFERA